MDFFISAWAAAVMIIAIVQLVAFIIALNDGEKVRDRMEKVIYQLRFLLWRKKQTRFSYRRTNATK